MKLSNFILTMASIGLTASFLVYAKYLLLADILVLLSLSAGITSMLVIYYEQNEVATVTQ